MYKHGVCYSQSMTITEVQLQNSALVGVKEAIPHTARARRHYPANQRARVRISDLPVSSLDHSDTKTQITNDSRESATRTQILMLERCYSLVFSPETNDSCHCFRCLDMALHLI